MVQQDSDKTFNIVLTGDGTAGHVWPHFALFEAINSRFTKHIKKKLKVFLLVLRSRYGKRLWFYL